VGSRAKRNSVETGGNWQTFSSEKYGFTVLMPKAPRERVDKTDTNLVLIEVHSFISETGAVAFTVSYMHRTPKVNYQKLSPAEADKVFDACRKGIFGKGNEILYEQPLTFENYVGRETAMTLLNGQAFITMRVYLVGSEIISTGALIPKNYSDTNCVARFLNSFQFIASITNK
jgi:hypothetical protein